LTFSGYPDIIFFHTYLIPGQKEDQCLTKNMAFKIGLFYPWFFLILATTVVTAAATPEKGKRPLTHKDYDAWEKEEKKK